MNHSKNKKTAILDGFNHNSFVHFIAQGKQNELIIDYSV